MSANCSFSLFFCSSCQSRVGRGRDSEKRCWVSTNSSTLVWYVKLFCFCFLFDFPLHFISAACENFVLIVVLTALLLQAQTAEAFAAAFPITSPEYRQFVNLRDFFERAWGENAGNFVRNPVSCQCPTCPGSAKPFKLHRPNHLQGFFDHLDRKSHNHDREALKAYLNAYMSKANGRSPTVSNQGVCNPASCRQTFRRSCQGETEPYVRRC